MTFEEVKIARDDPEFECDDLEFQRMIDIAIEKQIPKKPTPHIVNVDKIKIGNANWCKGTTVYHCPNCKDFISRLYTYCYKCGQALDWSDNNEQINCYNSCCR